MAFRGIGKTTGNIFNRTLGRLFGAGLERGAQSPLTTSGRASWKTRDSQKDWRVKLTIPSGSDVESIFLPNQDRNNLLEPLRAHNGIVFPLTPSVIVQHQAGYNPMTMTHSNFPHYAYSSSETSSVTVVGEFPVQNAEDAQAWVATLHFLRSVTKMFFGGQDLKGNPPPILHLNGYGEYVFQNVPVVVTNFSVELTQGVDYISTSQTRRSISRFNGVDLESEGVVTEITSSTDNIPDTWAPTSSIFTIQIQPVYSRDTVKTFNMKDFVRGNLNGKNNGIGII